MVLSEFLAAVRQRGAKLTEAKLRFAIKMERIPRPRLDGAHRYDFTEADVETTAEYFGHKAQEAVPCV